MVRASGIVRVIFFNQNSTHCMKIVYLPLTVILFLFSCSSAPDSKGVAEAPDALSSEVKLSSFSKRSEGDIISDLYKEELEKNASLKALDEQITAAYNKGDKSIDAPAAFMYNNNAFYTAAENFYGRNITDTVLSKTMQQFIAKSKADFATKCADVESGIKQVKSNQQKLEDYHAALKLHTANTIMLAYQKNGKPSVAEMKNAVATLNKAIKDTEAGIK